jgi:hypothetical protein
MKFKTGSLIIARTDSNNMFGPVIENGKIYVCEKIDAAGWVKILGNGAEWYQGHFDLVKGPEHFTKLEKVIYGIE